MKCPICATENRETAKFCDECGFKFGDAFPAEIEEVETVGIAPQDDSEETIAVPIDDEPTQKIEPVSTEEYEEDIVDDELVIDEEYTDENIDEVLEELSAGREFDEYDEELYRPESDDDYFGAFDPELYAPVIDEDYVDEGTDRLPSIDEIIDEKPITIEEEDHLAGFDKIDELNERLVSEEYLDEHSSQRAFHDGVTMSIPRIESDEDVKQKAFLASSAKKRVDKGKVALAIIAGIVVIAAIVAFATYNAELWGGKSVPDVTNMTQADAKTLLEDQGFTVRVSPLKSDDTEGLVKLMDPSAGSRVEKGSEVVVHVTVARTIPEIIGDEEKVALDKLAQEGFENVTVEKIRSDETEGTVVAVTPDVATRAKAATEISVSIAEPFTVPDISDMYLDDAIDAIKDAGLEYDVVYVYTEDSDDGYIIGTDPAAGTKVTEGSNVNILIARSRAKELVQATESLLVPGSSITIAGVEVQIDSVESVEYIGGDAVSYTIIGEPIVFGIATSPMSLSGTIVWNSANEVVSIS